MHCAPTVRSQIRYWIFDVWQYLSNELSAGVQESRGASRRSSSDGTTAIRPLLNIRSCRSPIVPGLAEASTRWGCSARLAAAVRPSYPRSAEWRGIES